MWCICMKVFALFLHSVGDCSITDNNLRGRVPNTCTPDCPQEIVLGLLQAFVYDPMMEWVSGQSQRRAVDAHVAERLLVAYLTETSGVWVCHGGKLMFGVPIECLYVAILTQTSGGCGCFR